MSGYERLDIGGKSESLTAHQEKCIEVTRVTKNDKDIMSLAGTSLHLFSLLTLLRVRLVKSCTNIALLQRCLNPEV